MIATSLPNGTVTSMSLRLCTRAPYTVIASGAAPTAESSVPLLRRPVGQEAIFSVTVSENAQLECTIRHWPSMSL